MCQELCLENYIFFSLYTQSLQQPYEIQAIVTPCVQKRKLRHHRYDKI